MQLAGQEVLLSNATGGTRLQVRIEKDRNPSDPADLIISNFQASFEFEYKYQTDVKALRKEFEMIGEQLQRESQEEVKLLQKNANDSD